MLGNFRNKDTLQIFNERWNINKNATKNISKFRKNNMTPSQQAMRVTRHINDNKLLQRDLFLDRFKNKNL